MSNSVLNPTMLFESLAEVSKSDSGSQFTALKLPDREGDLLAKGRDGQPAILVCVKHGDDSIQPPSITLEHLVVDHGLDCRVTLSTGDVTKGVFSVIRCVNADRVLHEYFLRSITPIVLGLPIEPSYAEIVRAVDSLAELFRRLSQPAQTSVQGLWSELFLVVCSCNPDLLIRSWHATPEDHYDFNSGEERIEVKSVSGGFRTHHFSFEQLHPPGGVRLSTTVIVIRNRQFSKVRY